MHSLYSFDLKALFSLFWIMDCRNEKQYTQALQTFMSQNLMWFICQGSPGKKNQHACPSICCCSVAQWCLTLCDPVDCSTPGFPVLTNSQSLLKIMSIESMIPSNHLVLCHPLLLLPPIFPSSRAFPVSQFFASGGQRIGASASVSVLPVNIPLGFTDLISVPSGVSQESSPTPQFKSTNSSVLSFLCGPIITSILDY